MSVDDFYMGFISGEGCFRVKLERISENSMRCAPKFST